VGQKIPLAAIVAGIFDLPKDAVAGLPRLTVIGGSQVLVESHRGIITFSRELIEIDGGKTKLTIRGDSMELAVMNRMEILIKGRIISAEIN
jgi:YabP family.